MIIIVLDKQLTGSNKNKGLKYLLTSTRRLICCLLLVRQKLLQAIEGQKKVIGKDFDKACKFKLIIDLIRFSFKIRL